jgi:segregation and condensation protein A
MNEDYRVQLDDVYNGPLDLLLYLIRKEEVDIYDIPIARITDQYLQYVTLIHQMDPNLAGEFLVMAAMLMEIKSRMLLPRPPEEEAGGDSIDPRSELVRQLLEYKRFKDAAGWLADAADTQASKFPRIPALPEVQNEIDLEDVHIWDLVEAFSRLLQATLAGAIMHEVEKDDTPLALHQQDIVDRLQREGPQPFSRIFEGRTRRTEMIGLFLAMLELIRQGIIRIEQDDPYAEIYLFMKVDLPEENPNPEETPQIQESATSPTKPASEPSDPIPEPAFPQEEEDEETEEDEIGDLGIVEPKIDPESWNRPG